MKKITLFTSLFVIACSLFLSCSKKEQEVPNYPPIIKKQIPPLSALQAKEFFESKVVSFGAKSIKETSRNDLNPFDPGDFTMDWDKAVPSVSKKGLVASVDVPIFTTNRYKAIRRKTVDSTQHIYAVDVYQKLVIVRGFVNDSVAMANYILTLIPDETFHLNNLYDFSDKFINSGDKGGFSGIAICSDLKGFQIRVDSYLDGVLKQGVFLSTSDTTKLKILLDKAKRIVEGIGVIPVQKMSEMFRIKDDPIYCYVCRIVHNEDVICTEKVFEDIVIRPGGNGGYSPDPRDAKDIWDGGYPPPPPLEKPKPGGGPGPGPGTDPDPGTGPPIIPKDDDPDTIPIPKKIPCKDFVRMISNPLPEMRFAPPNPVNPRGAEFGLTRFRKDGTRKPHQGIDLVANVGDPVYAVHKGTITQLIDKQPNRIKGDLPQGYTGDDDHAGNRIGVSVGGGMTDAYWHLQAGNAIGINPRTNKRFKKGDTVEIGDVIGYVGISGNANPKIPHLHYGVKNASNQWVDPFAYLNATLNKTTRRITTPCD